jgi:hypothetical protein
VKLHNFGRSICLASLVSAIGLLSGCALYPPGPVVQDYEQYRGICLRQNYSTVKTKIKNNCSSDLAPTAETLTAANTDTAIDKAIGCATETENLYGGFLLCRENEQIAAGVAIGTLAAGAAAVAASGISSIAAVSLAGVAGAGLGFDYMTYNKTKTQAYANAIVRLQCVVSDSQSLKGKSAALDSIQLPPSLSDVSDPAKSKQWKAKDEAESAQVRLALAQYKIAKERKEYAANSLIRLSPAILSTVDTIDVRAFAASQSGVPDSDQIAKGWSYPG